MDMRSSATSTFDTGGATPSPNTGQHRRQHVDLAAAARSSARRRPRRSRRCSAWPSTNLGVPVAQPDGRQGRRLRRRQDRHLRPAVGGKLFNVKFADDDAATPGVAPAKPVRASTSWSASPGPHAYDIPTIVDGHAHVRPRTSACPGCCTAASSGRAARAPTATARTRSRSRSTRTRSSTSRTSSRAGRQLPRRRRAEGVRRDPGGRAAEGEWSDPPTISRHGNLWKWMRDVGQRRARRRRAIAAARPGNVDAAMASAAKTYCGHVQVPLPDARADRPERRGRGRDARQRDHLQPRQERLRDTAAADRGGAEHCATIARTT